MPYAVEFRHVSPQSIAVVRRQARAGELSVIVPQACGEVWNFVRANGIAGAGRHVAVYLDCVMHLEVGVEVSGPIQGDGNVVPSVTPSGLVATTMHVGPYSQLGKAYDALNEWCKGHERTPAGVYWEIYGHWTDDETRLETEVFCLL
jgi:effector-binding domain-containing protein